MARYFKKRRIVGPSKNEEKLRRAADAEARERSVTRLSDQFPTVARLTVQLDLLSPQNHPLAEHQTRVFKPEDRADFSVPCPGRCGQGTFNLAAKVQSVVEARQPVSEGTGICQEPLFAGSADVCGVKLVCRIEAAYKEEAPAKEVPAAAPAPKPQAP
ncbi:MAG: hypothetical protein NTX64_03130 [Elusimicrobia bacterium]|nr:hypothetical protein [Elusimicrobiota bacterium]